jgi:signal transduction histidine kinase
MGLLVVTVLLLSSLSLVWFLAQQASSLDQFLGSEARIISGKLEGIESDFARNGDPGGSPGWKSRLAGYFTERANLATPFKTSLLVLADDRSVLGQSNRALDILPPPLPLAPGETRFQSVQDRGPAYRSVSTTFLLSPGHLGTFHLAVPLNSLDPPFYSFLTSLVVSMLATFLVLSFVGAGLIRHTLQPVRKMARTAGEISEKNLDVRIPLPPGDDDLNRLALTLNQLLARLETEFGFQERLVAELTHQLKTPLALLRGRNELGLKRSKTYQDLQSLVQDNLSDIDTVVNLLNTMLELVRLDSRLDKLTTQPVQFDALVHELVLDLAPLAEAKELRFTVSGPPVIVPADPEGLRQILMNLYDNAWKFSPPGGEVSTRWRTDPGQRRLEITVRNQGPPIPGEDLPRVFQRFFRTSQSPGENHGTGLGLAIVRSLVELHGGSIRATNPSEGGAAFEIELPLILGNPLP